MASMARPGPDCSQETGTLSGSHLRVAGAQASLHEAVTSAYHADLGCGTKGYSEQWDIGQPQASRDFVKCLVSLLAPYCCCENVPAGGRLLKCRVAQYSDSQQNCTADLCTHERWQTVNLRTGLLCSCCLIQLHCLDHDHISPDKDNSSTI